MTGPPPVGSPDRGGSMRAMNVSRSAFLIAVIVFAIASVTADVAAAQGTGAVLVGTVTGAQGGVLPGVTVTTRNVDTGLVRTKVTEPDGQYRLPALPPGRYDV